MYMPPERCIDDAKLFIFDDADGTCANERFISNEYTVRVTPNFRQSPDYHFISQRAIAHASSTIIALSRQLKSDAHGCHRALRVMLLSLFMSRDHFLFALFCRPRQNVAMKNAEAAEEWRRTSDAISTIEC